MDLIAWTSRGLESGGLQFSGVYNSLATDIGTDCPDFWASRICGVYNSRGSTFLGLPILDLISQTADGLESGGPQFSGFYSSRATDFGSDSPDFWGSRVWDSIVWGFTFLGPPILDLVGQTSGNL